MMRGFFGSKRPGGVEAQAERQYALIAEVEAYWDALNDAKDIPKRIDLDPRGIRGALSKSFILDSTNPDHPRFRIVGSDISALQNSSLFGTLFTELFRANKRNTIQTIVGDVARLPAKAQLDFRFASDHADEIAARMVLLPMRDTIGQRTRILGCLEFDRHEPHIQNPYGLDLTGSVVRPLGCHRQSIVRRLEHPALQLVSSTKPSALKPSSTQARTSLSLVTS